MQKLNFKNINKFKCALILLLCVISAVLILRLYYSRNVRIKEIHIPQNLDGRIISYLRENKIADYEYPVLSLKKDIPQKDLLLILDYYYMSMQIHDINICNRETTRTLEGTPYRRQWVEIDLHGEISIKKSEEDFRLKYDPDHPDAIREKCPETGYVRYPSIDLQYELSCLKLRQDIYNTFISYGKKVYPSLLLEEIDYEIHAVPKTAPEHRFRRPE
ncbi:MAG: hypothetical protein K6B17_07495 [Treponema sp.]|nr:hypothetical protein [Treponema sp.]